MNFRNLQVENSLKEARWVFPVMDDERVERIIQKHGLPEIVARLLSTRDVDADDVEGFLYPRLAQHFPDPFSMAGMADMAAFIAKAVVDGRQIGIFGDFDVDGATSTAIMLRFFRHLGMDCPFYIPDRLAEGYGPNINALKSLKEQGADIVIMCDPELRLLMSLSKDATLVLILLCWITMKQRKICRLQTTSLIRSAVMTHPAWGCWRRAGSRFWLVWLSIKRCVIAGIFRKRTLMSRL